MTEYDNETNVEGAGEFEGDSVLDVDTGDAREPSVVDDGEYLIRITGFRKDAEGRIVRTSASGNRYFIVALDIPEEEFSKSFTHILSVPTDDMDPKQLNAVKWALECFKRCFDLDELNFNNMPGKTGYAILRKDSDPVYGEQNKVRKLITGA